MTKAQRDGIEEEEKKLYASRPTETMAMTTTTMMMTTNEMEITKVIRIQNQQEKENEKRE